MPYITIPSKHKDRQLTFEDMLNGVTTLFDPSERHTYDTRTVWRDITPPQLLERERVNIFNMYSALKEFNNHHRALIETEDKSSLYHSFKIPKRSGGLRPIDAPRDELMCALKDLKILFETRLYASYHTCAFAYIRGRCTKDAVERHRRNNSRWFLKLDFSNFFGSTTPEFVMSRLETIFPFSEIITIDDGNGKEVLRKALSLCFLNGGLPQGTPISPTLTNLMMIPIDHYIAKIFRDYTPHICYTRYADDLLLSADISFKWSEVQQTIIEILQKFNAPFTIKKEKTHYGSRNGRNWILGLMLNKDNQISIGHKRKQMFKAMVFNMLNDYKKGVLWSIGDAQEIGGKISYYLTIEKDNIQKILDAYTKKFGISIKDVIKATLKQHAA
ncbi:MAG: reverse transcriptase family protein [Firmicutes bacterium]|nr:reverse transcriptase family protein [Bacillota bacterium]